MKIGPVQYVSASSEVIRGLGRQWVECDGCSKQFHIDCIPKKHQKEFNFNYVDDEVDFICHLCITDDKDCICGRLRV